MKTLYIIGIGPGKKEQMTLEAIDAMEKSDVIVGYTKYIELVKPHFPEKDFLQTGMTSETDRCQMAINKCIEGKNTSIVCSGDASVYGMASLIYELAQKPENNINQEQIKVIPGVTAALSGGAILGSPLTNDFAVISLSDLLTPLSVIEKRIESAAMGDFCMAIYNPMSKTRNHLSKVIQILSKYLSPDTICATARMIGRDGESSQIFKLKDLENANLDMFTTLFIGNSQTIVIGKKMITPRGYNV